MALHFISSVLFDKTETADPIKMHNILVSRYTLLLAVQCANSLFKSLMLIHVPFTCLSNEFVYAHQTYSEIFNLH